MRRTHARLDAYAANPFPGNRNETPFHDPCRNCQTLNMARLGKIRRLVTRLWGARTPLWLTEYAYETDPPDRARGIPWARHALFIGQSALRAAFALPRGTRVRLRSALVPWPSPAMAVR
jgi:hypothetical protein